ncbi:uncharacterized protein EI90DRAFT_3115783 [Cantharellus anzutake]|uniref:uncharacterized protein n=1 Tax=Cantharellus anzutake TaxID=1750568 RepID=UPI001906C030|nr:uncharacterized protein EI90DRAFT_3115783 [Cantharellus anzutake]KAF8341975.1 hypothetical protein EI90DRAFT_3115783 [Cantharellus anzutake]
MFSFEIEHNPKHKHKVPDGLFRHRKGGEDSDYSDGELDVEDGVKLVKEVEELYSNDFRNTSAAEVWEQEFDADEEIKIRRTCLMRKDRECKALEVVWADPSRISRLNAIGDAFEGKGVEPQPEEQMKKNNHPHRVKEYDLEGYWKAIITYLQNAKLLEKE